MCIFHDILLPLRIRIHNTPSQSLVIQPCHVAGDRAKEVGADQQRDPHRP